MDPPEVKDAKGKALIEGTDYTVSYDTDNFTDAKTIKVTITGIGNYTGIATKTYKITPAPLKVIADSASKPYDGKPHRGWRYRGALWTVRPLPLKPKAPRPRLAPPSILQRRVSSGVLLLTKTTTTSSL